MSMPTTSISERLTTGFNHLSRLLLYGVAMLFVVCATTGVMYYRLMDNEVATMEVALEVRSHIQAARADGEVYAHERSTASADSLRTHLSAAETELDDLGEHAGAHTIRDLLAQYRTAFNAVESLWIERGIDHKSGLQGAFRTTVHEVESMLKVFQNDQLYLAFLQVRRYEKDFHRTRSDKYLGKWDLALAQLEAAITEHSARATDHSSVGALQTGLDMYRAAREPFLEAAAGSDTQHYEDTYSALRGKAAKAIEGGINSAYVPHATSTLLMMRRHEKDYLLRGLDKYIDRLHTRTGELRALINESDIAAEEKALAGTKLDNYLSGFDSLVDCDRRLTTANADIDAIVESTLPELQSLVDTAQAGMKRSQIVVFAFSALALTLAIIAALVAWRWANKRSKVITDSVIKPILVMSQGMRAVANGNMAVRVDVPEGDEVGDMARDLNSMIEELGGIIQEIRDASTNTATSSEELSVSAKSIVRGAEEQNATVEQVGSSVHSLAEQANTIAGYAAQANTNAQAARQLVDEGSQAVQESVEAIELINQSSDQISKIIETIDQIATQTNLLALNAAIEAASAGANGKGFAVLAGEIRDLADRSTEAVADINTLISESSQRVQAGVNCSQAIGEVLERIISGVQETAASMTKIEQGTTKQNHAAEDVSQAMSGVVQVTEGNAASAEQMAQSSHLLATQSQHLQTLVERFSVSKTQHTVLRISDNESDKDGSSVEILALDLATKDHLAQAM